VALNQPVQYSSPRRLTLSQIQNKLLGDLDVEIPSTLASGQIGSFATEVTEKLRSLQPFVICT